MRLSDMAMHTSAKVLRINGRGAVRQRLLDMGVTKGAEIQMVRTAPLKDPIQVQVAGYQLALRRAEADLVEIDEYSGPDSTLPERRDGAEFRVALAGNPNCGKTSLFNALTGENCEVGNFPGVTVEYTIGSAIVDGHKFAIVDLPGTYSLTAYSIDEVVARDYLLKEKPDLLINVLDASTLDRQLYLTVQLLELRLPMVIALNMKDIAERHGIVIDTERFSRILGIPVVLTDANNAEGMDDLRQACLVAAQDHLTPKELAYSHELEGLIEPVEQALAAVAEGELPAGFPRRWLALKLLEHDSEYQYIADRNQMIQSAVKKSEEELYSHSKEDAQLAISEARLGIAAGIVMDCVKATKPNRTTISDRIDAFACGGFTGPLILAGIVYLLFVLIFGIAEDLPWVPLFNGEWVSPVTLLEMFFQKLGTIAGNAISSELLRSLVQDGIIAGVGSVLTYVPLIFVMFFCIAVLEDTGYIARVAFILDRVLRIFGLQGKSILSMIVSGGLGGGGCAVPGIMATRTLREEKDRLITIMVTPMMNCGAKFPLYVLLTGAFFARYQGLMMFLLWLLSWLFSMSAALLLRKTVFRGDQTPFIMELPIYHVPKMSGVLKHTWMRTWMYIRKAGTIILGISVILWALLYFPSPDMAPFDQRLKEIDAQYQENSPEKETALLQLKNDIAKARVRNSFAGKIGSFLTPVSQFAGFTWKENVALLGGFAAKEIVVGTLGTAYSMGDQTVENEEQTAPLAAQLRADPGWSPRKAFAMMIFVMLYAPCAAAIATIYRETASLKWTLFSIGYSTAFAFVIATLIYQIGGLFC